MVGAIQSGLSLSTEMLAQMRERLFERLDSNGDGQIDMTELAAASESGSQDQIPADLAQRLKEADTDGDEIISKEEFDSMTPPEKPPSDMPAMGFDQEMIAQMRQQMFSDLDANGDGQIDADEIAALTQNSDVSDDRAAGLADRLLAADSDGDGIISRVEFDSLTPPEKPPMDLELSTLYGSSSSGMQALNDYTASLDIMI